MVRKVSTEYRRLTDGRTDRGQTTFDRIVCAMHSIAR